MLHKIVKESAIYGSADFVSKLVVFFTFPIIAIALSPKIFGILELILTTIALLGIVMNCGLNNAVQRYYWDIDTKSVQQPIIVSSGMVAQLFLGVFLVIFSFPFLYFFYTSPYMQGMPITWVTLVASTILMIMSQWVQYILDVTRLHFKSWNFVIISLISRVGSALLGVFVVVYLELGVDGFLSVQVLAILLVIPLALYLIRKDLTFRVETIWTSKLIRFGYPFIFSGLAYWLFGSMDRWMIASMISIEEAGIYSISFRFVSIVLFVSMAFGQAWSPNAMKSRLESPKSYKGLYAKVFLILIFVMLTVGSTLSVFSGELIGIIMPEEYYGSAIPLTILCFGMIIQSTTQITATGISITKKTSLFANIAWVTAIINLSLNYILIPIYGIKGAAWATTISYLALTTSYAFFSQKLHPLPIAWNKVLIMFIIGFILLLFSLFSNGVVISMEVIIIKLFILVSLMGFTWKFVLFKSR